MKLQRLLGMMVVALAVGTSLPRQPWAAEPTAEAPPSDASSGSPPASPAAPSAPAAAGSGTSTAPAGEAPKDAASGAPADASSDASISKSPVVLTKEELAEKEARKACKIDICKAFGAPQAEGKDISCAVIKSWRKEQLTKMVAKLKVSWPYGPVRCTADVKLKREDLTKATTLPKHTLQLEKHVVTCSLDTAKEDARELKFEFSPKVAFEKGKAISAKMNWGKIEAPVLIKSAMWTATAADNTINMLSNTLTTDINDFISNKCDEVKADWRSK